MTKEEANKIPSMRIEISPFIEDCFYYALSQKGKLSKLQSLKAQKRLEKVSNKYDLETYYKGLCIAQIMISNIEKYGAACAEWC